MPIAGKTDAFENAWMLLVFNNTAIANIGDVAGLRATTAAGSLYFSLHTADPDETGNQSTSEIAYTSYARVAKARSAAGFTVTAGAVVPNGAVTFPAGTGGTGTATFFGLGAEAAGATMLMYAGAITPSIVCGNGVTPQLSTATTISEG